MPHSGLEINFLILLYHLKAICKYGFEQFVRARVKRLIKQRGANGQQCAAVVYCLWNNNLICPHIDHK